MDTYEENENIQEPELQETPEEIPEKTSRDISEETVVEISPELDTPKPTRPEKKKLFPILAAAVICIITLIAVAATFTITLKGEKSFRFQMKWPVGSAMNNCQHPGSEK
jgi:hypothetical protein